MAPLSKETVETANSAGEFSTSQVKASAKPPSGHMRADAVSLEVPVKVHGSRLTEVVRGIAPNTEPFAEQTTTMIVFPQGGVLRMSTAVGVGQMLVLTNLNSRQDAICRVVKVRTFSNLQGYVEVEFTHAQPGYWGMQFPSGGSAPQTKGAVSVPPVERQAELKEKTAADISWAPAPPAAKPFDTPPASEIRPDSALPPTPVFVPPTRPVSAFINIGSQEDVQASASATVTTRAGAPFEIRQEGPAAATPKISAPVDLPAAPPSLPPSTLSMSELRGDEQAAPDSSGIDSQVAVEEQQESSMGGVGHSENAHSTFGSLSGGASLDSETVTSEKAAQSHPNWALVGLSVAALLAIIAGGFFYWHSRTASHSTAMETNASSASQIAAASNAGQSAPSHTEQAVFPPSPQPIASSAPSNDIVAPVSAPSRSPSPNKNSTPPPARQPAVSERPAVPSSAPPTMMAQPVNAHPMASPRTDASQAIDAPSLEAIPASGSADSGAVPGIIGSNSAAPAPPEVKPEAAIKVGGQVTEPVLVSKVAPVYPVIAKEAGITGDIVIKTNLDKNGNVIHMEVVSGPSMLRQPALEALRRWKYKPSTLNGEPVPVTILVTLKFHR